VDNTKRLYIDYILRRDCLYDGADIFEEMVEAQLQGIQNGSSDLQD
jgi:hypothetical protein